MTVCPICKSTHVTTRQVGRDTGRTLAVSPEPPAGAASTWSGAQVGASFGAVGGPVGIALGGIAGALLGGLLGATAGSVAGSRLGDVVDAHYLGNCECQDCGAVFTSPSRS
jgi:uncharacterized protein YcfJ